ARGRMDDHPGTRFDLHARCGPKDVPLPGHHRERADAELAKDAGADAGRPDAAGDLLAHLIGERSFGPVRQAAWMAHPDVVAVAGDDVDATPAGDHREGPRV